MAEQAEKNSRHETGYSSGTKVSPKFTINNKQSNDNHNSESTFVAGPTKDIGKGVSSADGAVVGVNMSRAAVNIATQMTNVYLEKIANSESNTSRAASKFPFQIAGATKIYDSINSSSADLETKRLNDSLHGRNDTTVNRYSTKSATDQSLNSKSGLILPTNQVGAANHQYILPANIQHANNSGTQRMVEAGFDISKQTNFVHPRNTTTDPKHGNYPQESHQQPKKVEQHSPLHGIQNHGPHFFLGTYQDAIMQARHHAAEHQQDFRENRLNSSTMENNSPPGYPHKMGNSHPINHQLPSIPINHEANPGGMSAAAITAAVLHHQAAASAADLHLKWRMNVDDRGDVNRDQSMAIQKAHDERTRRENQLHQYANGPTEISRDEKMSREKFPQTTYLSLPVEIQRGEVVNRESLMQQYAARARSISERNANNDLDRSDRSIPRQLNNMELKARDRKRSLPENLNSDANKAAANKRRISDPNPESFSLKRQSQRQNGRNDLKGNNSTGIRINSSSGSMLPNLLIEEKNISDAMDMALDEAIESDTSKLNKKLSSGSRPVEMPLTYLVRQLLGQVEVIGDEPAVVLTPNLVKDASQKIRSVINKLIELVAVKSRQYTQDQERHYVRKEENNNNSNDSELITKEVHHRSQQQKSIDSLMTFAEQAIEKVKEHERTIEDLQLKLHKKEMENIALQSEVSSIPTIQQLHPLEQNSDSNSKYNETLRNLVSLIDKVKEHERTIEDLQLKQHKKEMENKALQSEVSSISFVKRAYSDVHFVSDNQPLFDMSIIDKKNEQIDALKNEVSQIESLKKELENVQSILKAERQQSETSLKAYMRSAVHALMMQQEELQHYD